MGAPEQVVTLLRVHLEASPPDSHLLLTNNVTVDELYNLCLPFCICDMGTMPRPTS